MINEDDVRSVSTVIVGTGGLLGTAIAVRSYILRRWSRDKLEGVKDRAEIELIDELRQENRALRQRADTAFDERNKAIQELGGLRFEVHALKTQVESLQTMILQLRAQIDKPKAG